MDREQEPQASCCNSKDRMVSMLPEEGRLPDVLTWVGVDAIGKHSFRSRLPVGLWGEAGETVHPNGGRDARHGWCSDARRGAATWFQGCKGVGEEGRQTEKR